MKDWWKDPRLDDEGTYDYLAEELPKDHAEWEFNRYGSRCDSCGKERLLLFRATHYFYCWDGWDSMDNTECWKCMIKRQICTVKHKIKKRIKIFKETLIIHHNTKSLSLEECYKLAAKLVK